MGEVFCVERSLVSFCVVPTSNSCNKTGSLKATDFESVELRFGEV